MNQSDVPNNTKEDTEQRLRWNTVHVIVKERLTFRVLANSKEEASEQIQSYVFDRHAPLHRKLIYLEVEKVEPDKY